MRIQHATVILDGRCSDCSQGIVTPSSEGFEYFDEERDGRGFWFCRYCGSNHVIVFLDNGHGIEQGDLPFQPA
jgi:hypothetical protein